MSNSEYVDSANMQVFAAPFEPSKPLNKPTQIPVPVVVTDNSDFVDENHDVGLRLKVGGVCRHMYSLITVG